MSGRPALPDLRTAPAAPETLAAVTCDGPRAGLEATDGSGATALSPGVTGPARFGRVARDPGRSIPGDSAQYSKSAHERVRTVRFTQGLLTINNRKINVECTPRQSVLRGRAHSGTKRAPRQVASLRREARAVAEPEPVGLREQSKLEAFERIRSTAVALLAEKSLNDLTTREIAQRAGVGEATLFRYVESKWALVILAYGDRLDELLGRIVDADRRTAAAVAEPTGMFYCQRVLDAFWMRSEMYMESPENGAIYLRSGSDPRTRPDSPWLKRSIEQQNRLVALVAGIIREGQAAGFLRDEFDAEIIADNCYGTYVFEMEITVIHKLDQALYRERLDRRLRVQVLPLIREAEWHSAKSNLRRPDEDGLS
jgi:AcrR family transcriptional regulator